MLEMTNNDNKHHHKMIKLHQDKIYDDSELSMN